jgi:hypothetical protein
LTLSNVVIAFFVNRRQVFLAVLKAKFRNSGLHKINNEEFIIQETGSKRQINLHKPWELVFKPGQKVEMSMIFKLAESDTTSCPNCKAQCDATNEDDVEWLVQFQLTLDFH